MDKMQYVLTFPMQKKKERIIEYKANKDKINKRFRTGFICTCFGIILIILRANNLFEYLVDLFDKAFVARGTRVDLSIFDLLVVLFSLCSIGYLYVIGRKQKKANNKYEELRADIVESVNNKLCYHDYSCDCKRKFIEDMDKKGIDVVFK